jgi:spermidine synthase
VTLPARQSAPDTPGARLLLTSVLVVATCGLVYELIAATMASYLLGDSVTQFSLVIGVYLSAMGLGSWLSKSIERDLYDRFILVQLVIAVVGGLAAGSLFLGYAYLSTIRPLLFAILVIVGTMVGLEIPLLMRILKDGQELKDLVARVLAFDYIGSLLASLLFPLALLPHLGLVRTSLLFGLLNALVALACARTFRDRLVRPRLAMVQSAVIAAVLGVLLAFGARIERFAENQLYDAPVVFSDKTAYQRLTLTRWADDVRLYIDGNLQFSSLDEHRYHEALVHPAMAEHEVKRALVLGGGDGLAARELLKYPALERIDLVDLDPGMTDLFRRDPMLVRLNRGSLTDARVNVHNTDAMRWLEDHVRAGRDPFDLVLVDLPDPNNFSLGKLYSHSFYRLVRRALAPSGVGVVQSTSPYLAPRSFWCIVNTLAAADLHPRPYHAHVPSFGDWGFVLVSHAPRPAPQRLAQVDLQFLSDDLLPGLFVFPADQRPADVDINRLGDQLLVHYYEEDLRAPAGRRG